MTAVQDLNDYSRLEKAFMKSVEALMDKDRHSYVSGLIQGLIHNVNGPLQNISMLVELLVRVQDQVEELARARCDSSSTECEAIFSKQHKRFHQLSEQITALSEMLRDFVILQEIERNESEVDLNLVLEKLVRVFRADLFFKHQVDVELRLADGVPLVRVLGRHVVPALIHLFRNALTAVRNAPVKRVVIESVRRDDKVVITFTDSGCGLDEHTDEEAFFDLFFSRWPASVLQQEKDTDHFGVGLYAARRYLERYGATITLQRAAEGTSAIVEIPLTA